MKALAVAAGIVFWTLVLGVAVLISRASEPMEWPAPFHALATLEARDWLGSDCPLCRQGIAMAQRGSRDVPSP